MFKIEVSFIPDQIPNALCRDKVRSQVVVAISSSHPEEKAATEFTGQYAKSIARWLRNSYGSRGHTVGESACPMDAFYAISRSDWIRFRVLEGQKILEIPMTILPEGAVD